MEAKEMNNPCSQCIVKPMCIEECWQLMRYVDQQVINASEIEGFGCSTAFLHAIGRRLLQENRFTHVICIEESYYCMMVRDRDILIVSERNPWRWLNNRQPM